MPVGDSDTSRQIPRKSLLRARSGMMYSPRTPLVRRIRRQTLMMGIGVGMLIWVAMACVTLSLSFRFGFFFPIMVGSAVCSLLGTLGSFWLVTNRQRKLLEAASWHRCEWCEYDTTATGDSGQCPECGHEFSSELLQRDFYAFTDSLGWRLPSNWTRGRARSDAPNGKSGAISPPNDGAPRKGARDYVDRSTSRGGLAQFIGMIAGYFVLAFMMRAFNFRLPQTYFFTSLVAFCGGFGLLIRMAYMQYRRMRLTRRNWNICPWCERDTREIGPVGTCPKCGGEFSATDLKADFDGACRTSALMFWLRPDDANDPARPDGSPQ